MSAGASTSACRADGRRLPPSAPRLRPDPQILSARPRPADRRARRAGRRQRAGARLRHRPQPRPGGARAIRTRASSASTFRPRCWRRRRRRCGAKASPTGSRWRRATRPTSTPRTLFGRAGFDRVFISYALSMIPDWEKTIAAALAALDAGRLAAHRRFRPAGTPAALVPRRAARLAGEIPRQPA